MAGASGLALGDDDLARIEACEDDATLDRWITRVQGATSAAELLG